MGLVSFGSVLYRCKFFTSLSASYHFSNNETRDLWYTRTETRKSRGFHLTLSHIVTNLKLLKLSKQIRQFSPLYQFSLILSMKVVILFFYLKTEKLDNMFYSVCRESDRNTEIWSIFPYEKVEDMKSENSVEFIYPQNKDEIIQYKD